jgi:peptide methionine sulfoxide reductase MsrA
MDYPYAYGKRQYRSAVFYLDDEQGETARELVKRIEKRARGREVYIDVEKVTKFYRAEEYHQDFLDKDMLS